MITFYNGIGSCLYNTTDATIFIENKTDILRIKNNDFQITFFQFVEISHPKNNLFSVYAKVKKIILWIYSAIHYLGNDFETGVIILNFSQHIIIIFLHIFHATLD